MKGPAVAKPAALRPGTRGVAKPVAAPPAAKKPLPAKPVEAKKPVEARKPVDVRKAAEPKPLPGKSTRGTPRDLVETKASPKSPLREKTALNGDDRPGSGAMARPVVEQVSSSGDSRPKKNQAGLTSKELEHFRDLLLEKRRELIGDMNSMEREALHASESNLSTLPIHMADMGTDNYEQEFTLGLVEKDRNLLREINHALAKIQNGTYGICEGSGKPIPKVRLEYQPWARHSIEYARMKEKHQLMR